MTARITALVLLTGLALGWAGARVGEAQIVLDRQPNRVRLWLSEGSSLDVPLARSFEARVAVRAEAGHIVGGMDGASGELFFLHHADGSTRELPVPASRSGGGRTWPVLLASADRLEGAIWLEGTDPQDLAIRSASWNGTSWEAVEVVSPSRGLPQLAVSATVLSDGSWLAVWAGYDGSDDEIYWSRRVYGAWSPPRPLHPGNRVPDILPSVIAHGDGARAAWSFYDGNDYRVRTAEWDGTAWQVGGPLAGLGAVDAGWQRIDERVFVTYHSVEPEAWSLVEIDTAGTVVPISTRVGDSSERPLVAAAAGSRPRLVFPSRPGRGR